ncbi:MAG: hypothetical protein ACI9NQ_002240 [Paracoccaceae bacterium]|jgi:hypothetical protein
MKRNFTLPNTSAKATVRRLATVFSLCAFGGAQAANYQDTVIGLAPNFYYELNETDTEGGAIDTMGNALAPGVFNGAYDDFGPMVGGPGALELFEGIALPGLGGSDNLAHYSNNAGHITLGDGNLYGAKAMTVAFFFKAGPAEGGDRLFTNNITDPTKSFQVVTANDGLVLSVDPNTSGETAERTLYLEDNSEPDRRLIDSESGWFHVVASTEGATGAERAANLKLWINGVDRTDNLQPNSTGWGTDTGLAKIGGRRAAAPDSTTHSGAQDEVAIWLNRVLTDNEIADLWESATAEKLVPLEFTDIERLVVDEKDAVKVTWQSKPGRKYIILSSSNLEDWVELNDSHPSEGALTSFTDTSLPDNTTRTFYRVEEVDE